MPSYGEIIQSFYQFLYCSITQFKSHHIVYLSEAKASKRCFLINIMNQIHEYTFLTCFLSQSQTKSNLPLQSHIQRACTTLNLVLGFKVSHSMGTYSINAKKHVAYSHICLRCFATIF